MTSEVNNGTGEVAFDLENHKRERRKQLQEQIKKLKEEIKDHEYDIKAAGEQIKHLEKELGIFNEHRKERSRSWITVRRKRDRKGKWAYWFKVEKWYDENGTLRENWFQQITEAEYNEFERKYKRKN